MALNFRCEATEEEPERFGMTEAWLPDGPLDPAVGGPRALQLYRRAPQPIPAYDEGAVVLNRGARIERY